jgi:hypothetical protein
VREGADQHLVARRRKKRTTAKEEKRAARGSVAISGTPRPGVADRPISGR